MSEIFLKYSSQIISVIGLFQKEKSTYITKQTENIHFIYIINRVENYSTKHVFGRTE